MRESKAPHWALWLSVSAGLVLVDQLVKLLIRQKLASPQPVHVTPFFDLVLVYNPGAAFSLLSTASGWQRELFIGIALAASVLILYLLRKYAEQRLFCLGLSLILAGAIGNLLDRVQFGAVVDFLHFHIGEYYFPAFNVADSAITCGAGLLIWDGLWRSQARSTG